MTICPIALAVGCEKCPAFKFCPLTTVLGDQREEDEVDSSNKFLEESFLVEKVFDIWEKDFPQEKNNNEESKKE